MITGRVLDVNKAQTKSGKDIYTVNVESGGKTAKYQCWDAAIADKAGKEVTFEVKPAPEGTTFNPTMILPKGDGSTGFAKKPWATKEMSKDQLDVMILSYKKDLMVKCLDVAYGLSGRSDVFQDHHTISKWAYDIYLDLGKHLFAHKKESDAPKE